MSGETSNAAAPEVSALPRRAMLLGYVLGAWGDLEEGFRVTHRYGDHLGAAATRPTRRSEAKSMMLAVGIYRNTRSSLTKTLISAL